jgi:hypothetical protein
MSDLATSTLQDAVTDAAQAAVATPAEVASSVEAPAAAPPPAPAAPEPAPAPVVAAPEPPPPPPEPEPEAPASPPPPAPEPEPEMQEPAPAPEAEAPQAPAHVADAPDEPAPSTQTPSADDSDALVTAPVDPGGPPADDPALATSGTSTVLDGGAAAPLNDTDNSAADDTPIGQVLDGVSTGPLPDEVTTTPITGDAVTTVTDDLSIAPLPDANVTTTTGDESLITAITDDISIAPLPDTGTTKGGDSDLATLGTLQDAIDDTPLAAVGNTLQDATDDTPLAALADTVTTITDDTGLTTLADTVTTITDDTGLTTLADTVTTITDDTGLTTLGSLTHSVGGIADATQLGALTERLTDATSPLVTTAETAVAPLVGDSAIQIGAPLATTVDTLGGSLADTVATVTAPFVVTVPPAEPQRSPAPTGDGTAATPGGDSSTDGAVAPGTYALVDGAAVSAAPATAAPGADSLLDPELALTPALGLPGAVDPSLRLDAAAPDTVSGTASALAMGQPGAIVDAPGIAFGPGPQGLSVIPDAKTADPLSPTDSALAAIAEVAPDARVLVSAAVLAMAAAAIIGPRTGGSGTDVSMAFTNVRLLPCLVKESLARHVEMLTEAVAARGSGAPAASQAAEMLGAASGTRGAAAEGTPGMPERAQHAFQSALESFRDGFEQAIVDERDDVGEGLRDSRLMLQIGMLLGFVYVGFLSVWFWATRARGESRPGAM